jgi:hypothetical protein
MQQGADMTRPTTDVTEVGEDETSERGWLDSLAEGSAEPEDAADDECWAKLLQ